MKNRITVRDIAKEAKVHYTTVARALKDDPRISQAKREEIQKIAKRLGYVPDAMVAALAAYRQQLRPAAYRASVAWLSSDEKGAWKTSWYRDYFLGASAVCEQLGYQLEEFPLGKNVAENKRLLSVLKARNITAALLGPLRENRLHLRLDWDQISAVCFEHTLAWPKLHTVTSNHFGTTILAVQKLHALGYRRIGLMVARTADARVNQAWTGGFLVSQIKMKQSDRVPPIEYMNTCNPEDFKKWQSRYNVDAVIIHGKKIEDFFQTCGFNIPEDIGVVTLEASRGGRLAGIGQNEIEIGASAMEWLIGMIHRGEYGIPPIPRSILIEPDWIDGPSVRRVR